MNAGWWILIAIAVIVLWYGVSMFNGLITLKNNAKKAWSNIDVLLKQRHDELPKLVETCKQYMNYEAPALQKIIEARAQATKARESGSPKQVGAAEGNLDKGLMNLYAVAEQYPNLKADESFKFLQTRISGLESAIADRREFYNASAAELDTRREQFPDRIVAALCGVKQAEMLQFSAPEIADVNMKTLFDG